MIARLRPLFALFTRSLREQSRAKFTSLARGGIALVVLLFIAMNERNFASRSAPGQSVLIMLVIVNFFVIAIFGLSTFASAITEEKEEDTLGLLQMTRLNPLAILLGKSTARLFDGLLLLAVQVPFTMLCITLGGVSLDQVLRCYGILAAFLFFLCNIALLWSVICRRTTRATSMTVLSGVVLYFMPFFFLWMTFGYRVRGTGLGWGDHFIQWWFSINPIYDLTRAVQPRSIMPFGGGSVPFNLVGGAICFALAWMLFKRFCGSGTEVVPGRTRTASAGVPRRAAHPRAGRRAIAWKDFHFLAGGWKGLLIRTFVYIAIGLLLVWWMATVNRSRMRTAELGVMFWVFGIMSFTIEVGLVSSRMFGSERKRKTLGALYTLPLGTGRLIREKIRGALPQLFPSLLCTFIGIGIIVSEERVRNWLSDDAIAGLILYVSGCVFFAVLVMYLSLRMRRSPFAAGVCVMILLSFIIPFVLTNLHSLGNDVAEMLTISVLGWIGAAVIASRIPGRIAACAAEE